MKNRSALFEMMILGILMDENIKQKTILNYPPPPKLADHKSVLGQKAKDGEIFTDKKGRQYIRNKGTIRRVKA